MFVKIKISEVATPPQSEELLKAFEKLGIVFDQNTAILGEELLIERVEEELEKVLGCKPGDGMKERITEIIRAILQGIIERRIIE